MRFAHPRTIVALFALLALRCVPDVREVRLQGLTVRAAVQTRGDNPAIEGTLLQACTLMIADARIAIPFGTWFRLDSEGEMRVLRPSRELRVTVGVNTVPFAARKPIELVVGGRIGSGMVARACTLRVASSTVVAGPARSRVPWRRDRFSYLAFHDNGMVRECWLAADGAQTVMGAHRLMLAPDQKVEFDRDGVLAFAIPVDSTVLQVGSNLVAFDGAGAGLSGDWGLWFHPNGVPRNGYVRGRQLLAVGSGLVEIRSMLGAEQSGDIDNVEGDIAFHPNGTLAAGILAVPTEFTVLGRTARLLADQPLYFDSSGNLELRTGSGFRDYQTEEPLFSDDTGPDDPTDSLSASDTTPAFEWPTGLFESERLTRDTTLTFAGNLLACKAGQTSLWSSENASGLWGAVLTKPAELRVGTNTVAFLADDSGSAEHDVRIEFYRNGAICGGLTRTDQTLAVGSQTIRFWRLMPGNGNGKVFFDNGGLIGGELYADTRVRIGSRIIALRATRYCQVWRESSEYADVGFHRDGSVAYGYPAEPLTAAIAAGTRAWAWYGAPTVRIAAGQKVMFRRTGEVQFEGEYGGIIRYKRDGEPVAPCLGKKLNACECEFAGGPCASEVTVSSGTDLQVYVDGAWCGWTPVMIRGLAPGVHRIATESDETIAARIDQEADSIQSMLIVERLVARDNLSPRAAQFYDSKVLQEAGAFQLPVACDSHMRLHFHDEDTLRSAFTLDLSPRAAAAAQRDPVEASNHGWILFEDETDTAMFRALTQRAMSLLGPDGQLPKHQWIRCNLAMVHILSGRTQAAIREYRTAMGIASRDTLAGPIASDFRAALSNVPALKGRIDSVSSALDIPPAP